MTRRAWVILTKELVDNLRDRKAWSRSLVMLLIGPLMLMAMIRLVSRLSAKEATQVLELPVAGAERAPGLMEYLGQRNLKVVPAPKDPEAAVRNFECDVVLVILPSYGDDFRAGRPAPVRLVYDDSRTGSLPAVARVREALAGYSGMVGSLRLLVRGVSARVLNALAVENDNLATAASRAQFVFAMVPMFLLMSLFIGGLYVAIDVMAGERERGSLEPLLANPVTPAEVVLGKLGATTAFAAVVGVLVAVGFTLVLNFTPLDVPGLRIGLSPGGLAALIGIVAPVMVMASALQMLVASLSRTFKEAQSTAQLLTVLPMLPGMLRLFNQNKPPPWAPFAPIYGQNLLIEQVLKGEPVALATVAMVSGATLLVAGVLVTVTIWRYDAQRALFRT
ncbi:MAG TPA: ABC transporter permease [Polyangia bacterium]|jgi:sodium transport system permease protein|nr:ABC transporter permease [Polyangia bacterium]